MFVYVCYLLVCLLDFLCCWRCGLFVFVGCCLTLICWCRANLMFYGCCGYLFVGYFEFLWFYFVDLF